jgi:hypothetical protein
MAAEFLRNMAWLLPIFSIDDVTAANFDNKTSVKYFFMLFKKFYMLNITYFIAQNLQI